MSDLEYLYARLGEPSGQMDAPELQSWAAEEIERLRDKLSRIASAAHSGGRLGGTEMEVLVTIRRATLDHWDHK